MMSNVRVRCRFDAHHKADLWAGVSGTLGLQSCNWEGCLLHKTGYHHLLGFYMRTLWGSRSR